MRQVVSRPCAGRDSTFPLRALLALVALAALAGCAAAGHAAPPPPTATPTAEQRVATLAQRAAGLPAQSVVATFDGAGNGTLTLIATIGGPVPGTQAQIAAAQERSKTICFQMERVVWTSAMPADILPGEVKVVVVGPIYDDYADLTTGPYAAADLKAATAHQLDWAHLTPDAAWDVYAAFLRPAYRPKTVGL
ncbi:MAG TPA: hypothetical protein VGS80_17070 [Ktedonobacterales bacterium]|nr:hypothetical protein [Ktedonobacterales bacterium]